MSWQGQSRIGPSAVNDARRWAMATVHAVETKAGMTTDSKQFFILVLAVSSCPRSTRSSAACKSESGCWDESSGAGGLAGVTRSWPGDRRQP